MIYALADKVWWFEVWFEVGCLTEDAEEAEDRKAAPRQSVLGGQGDRVSVSSELQTCPTEQKVGVSTEE